MVVYSLSADLSAAATGTLENTAEVLEPDDVTDPLQDNNVVTHTAQLTPVVDLTLTKDDFQTEAIPGLPLTYTITVSNAGPSDLSAATLEDLFPLAFLDPAWSCVATGALAFVEAEVNGQAGVVNLDAPYGVAISPDPDGAFGPLAGGDYLYVASRSGNSIDQFARDPLTGELAFVTSFVDGVDDLDGFGGPGGLAISPDGKHLYATGAVDDAIAVLGLEAGSGALSLIQVTRESDPEIDGLDGAATVAVSGDGANVYVGSEDDDAIAVFGRDPATGELLLLQRLKEGFGGMELGVLDRPAAIAVAPDGRQVLVASAESDSLAVFDRAPGTGTLALAQVLHDGEAGVDGLDFPQALVVSPGGQFVYLAGLADDAIAIFARDLELGELSYLGAVRQGVAGVTGLDGVRGLTLSPDGLFLFAAGFNDDAMAIFRRDGLTGALIQLQVERQGVGGVTGLDGARAVTASPDGLHLYVGSEHADAVAVFARVGQGSCAPAGESDLLDSVDLAVGAQVTYQVLGTVDSSATGQLINTVTAIMPPGTTNVGDTSATDIDLLTPVSELSVLKTDGVTTAIPGTSTIYLITVANSGPSDAPASQVTDPLPAEVTGATWACSGHLGGACSPSGVGSLSESVDLPAGADVVFALAAAIDPAAVGLLVNTATVAPAAGVTDPNLGDNSSTDTDTLVPTADLELIKSVDDATVETGDPIEFTLAVTNLGPSVATSVSVIDLLPADTGVVSASGTGWTCTPAAGSVTCTLPVLPPGAAPPIVISATAPTSAGNYVNGATVSAASADPAAANNTGTAAFAVVVLEPPTVLNLDSVDSTGDGELSQMETAEVPISQLIVEFSEELFDPPGDTDPQDVTNPASYLLLAAGSDGNFTTTTCGALGGDDAAVEVNAVAYVSATSTATLDLQGGIPLPDGLYRLLVCGVAGVRDLDGNPLDGDGDGNPGDDFGRYFRIKISNILARPHFDFATDVDAWTFIGGAPTELSHDPADGDGFPLSGSAKLANLAGSTQLEILQCLPLPGANAWVHSGEVRTDLSAGSVQVHGRLDYVQGGTCITPASTLASWPTSVVSGGTGGIWRQLALAVPEPPVGATGLRARWRVESTAGSIFEVRLDNLTLVEPLFADGFETNDTSRWSSTQP